MNTLDFDKAFNRAMYGYLIRSMMSAKFSRDDIDTMCSVIDRYGIDRMTIEQATDFYKAVQNGLIDFYDAENLDDRIKERP